MDLPPRGNHPFVRAGTIYLLDRTGHPKPVHAGTRPDFSPEGNRWSPPQGRFIALTRSGNCSQPPDALIVSHADGMHPRVVLAGDPVQDPNWQPIPRSAA